jgi:MFS family permease
LRLSRSLANPPAKKLDPTVPEYYFGLIMGAFNFSQMITSPVFGYWLDRRPMKEVVVFCMVIGAVGNTFYALAPNIYIVLVGRLISGAGGNIYNTGMTYVVRVSEPEERSALYAKINLIYYMGMLFGPALNYPLSLLGRYQFGLFTVDALSAPGLLMVFMLTIAVVFVHFAFEEPAYDDEPEAENNEEAEAIAVADAKCCGLAKYKPLFSSFTLVAVLLLQFVVQFNQISLETIVTPVTKLWFGYGQLENSLIYAIITAIFFLWFFAIIFISKYVQDRTLIVFGAIWFGASFCFSVGWMYAHPSPDTYAMPLYAFALSVAMVVSGIPFFLSSISSLFSKLIGNKKIQGMGQSMLGAANSLANILGPVISGVILPRVDVMFAVLLGTWVLILVLLFARWSALYTDPAGRMRQVDETVAAAKGSASTSPLTDPSSPRSEREAEDALVRRPRAMSNSFKDYVEHGLVPAKAAGGSIQDHDLA